MLIIFVLVLLVAIAYLFYIRSSAERKEFITIKYREFIKYLSPVIKWLWLSILLPILILFAAFAGGELLQSNYNIPQGIATPVIAGVFALLVAILQLKPNTKQKGEEIRTKQTEIELTYREKTISREYQQIDTEKNKLDEKKRFSAALLRFSLELETLTLDELTEQSQQIFSYYEQSCIYDISEISENLEGIIKAIKANIHLTDEVIERFKSLVKKWIQSIQAQEENLNVRLGELILDSKAIAQLYPKGLGTQQLPLLPTASNISLQRRERLMKLDARSSRSQKKIGVWNREWRELGPIHLSGIDLSNRKLVHIDLHGANLQRIDLEGTDLQQANLQRTDLQGANLQRTNLQGTDLQQANLQQANLQQANLQGADLQSANLQSANLEGANLQGVNLEGAKLFGAKLFDADLQDANLQGTDLYGANLYGANLYGANLQGTNLEDANIQNANIQGAKYVTLDQVKQARNWQLAFYDPEFRKELEPPRE